jgi:hypothetical protein
VLFRSLNPSSNLGGGALNWDLTKKNNSAWLGTDKTSGTDSATIKVTMQTTTITPGTYTDTIWVNCTLATNNPFAVKITYTVTPMPPQINLSTKGLTFTATKGQVTLPAAKTINITNGGGDTLRWKVANITTTATWLSVTPLNGKGIGVLTVQPNTTNLNVGTYTASFDVIDTNASNSPQNVSITYTIADKPVVIVRIPKNYSAKPGEKVTVPVEVTTDLAGKLAKSYVIKISYKKHIVLPEKINTTGTLITSGTPLLNITHGTVYDTAYISYTGTADLTGTGNLIQMEILALLGDTCDTPLRLESVDFNTEGPLAGFETEKRFALIGRCNSSYVKTTSVAYLAQNSPNPMVSGLGTNIQYNITSAGNVKLKVYDILGRTVATLVDEYKSEGLFQVRYDGKNLTTGIYFYRLQCGNIDEYKKLIVIK